LESPAILRPFSGQVQGNTERNNIKKPPAVQGFHNKKQNKKPPAVQEFHNKKQNKKPPAVQEFHNKKQNKKPPAMQGANLIVGLIFVIQNVFGSFLE